MAVAQVSASLRISSTEQLDCGDESLESQKMQYCGDGAIAILADDEIGSEDDELNPRKKKHLLGVVSGAEGEVGRDEICNISKKKINSYEELNKGDAEVSDEKTKSPPSEKRSEYLQDNVQGVEQASTAPDGAKKGPSRSARRKKAKRQWKRKLAKISQKMEVLPPSESSWILKDKEVLCVKREEMDLAEAIEGAGAGNLLDYAEVNRKEPVNYDMLLLANKELENKPLVPVETVYKKRKSSTELQASMSEHLQENVEGAEQASIAPDGAKKGPSKITRRKKAKKQWKRQLAKISQKLNTQLEPDVYKAETKGKEANGNPKGLTEGFVLPPSESSWILKDKEILCVKKEEMDLSEAIEGAGAGNLLDYVEVNRKGLVNNDVLLLANGELENKPTVPVETVPKKRKYSTELQASKSGHLRENGEGVEQASIAPDGAKKGPSRSARRKKWKREHARISKKLNTHLEPEVYKAETIGKEANGHPKMEGFVLPPSESSWILKDKEVLCVKREEMTLSEAIEGAGAGNLLDYAEVNWKGPVNSDMLLLANDELENKPSVPVETVSKKRKASTKLRTSESEHLQENVEGVEQAFTTPDGAKKGPSRSARRKKAKKQWNRELAKISQKLNTHLEPEVYKAESKKANGHPKGLVIDFIDFDKLSLCTSPKEGDVIAYRLVELSSSWTPELSSFRVGKISHFNANNIVLNPIPEYPNVLDKMGEDGPDNNSIYKEDGSLEIKFEGLVDVRSVKQSNSDGVKEDSNGGSQTPQGDHKDFGKYPSLPETVLGDEPPKEIFGNLS